MSGDIKLTCISFQMALNYDFPTCSTFGKIISFLRKNILFFSLVVLQTASTQSSSLVFLVPTSSVIVFKF